MTEIYYSERKHKKSMKTIKQKNNQKQKKQKPGEADKDKIQSNCHLLRVQLDLHRTCIIFSVIETHD